MTTQVERIPAGKDVNTTVVAAAEQLRRRQRIIHDVNSSVDSLVGRTKGAQHPDYKRTQDGDLTLVLDKKTSKVLASQYINSNKSRADEAIRVDAWFAPDSDFALRVTEYDNDVKIVEGSRAVINGEQQWSGATHDVEIAARSIFPGIYEVPTATETGADIHVLRRFGGTTSKTSPNSTSVASGDVEWDPILG